MEMKDDLEVERRPVVKQIIKDQMVDKLMVSLVIKLTWMRSIFTADLFPHSVFLTVYTSGNLRKNWSQSYFVQCS